MKSCEDEIFPIRNCFMLAVGGLGVEPQSFWELGMAELYAIMEARAKYTGTGTTDAPTKEELKELMGRLA